MKKENKTITVGKDFITVNYHDTKKHFVYPVQKDHGALRDIKLFGKSFKRQKASEIRKDFLTPQQRELFDDLLYSRKRMTQQEIDLLPVNRKYRILVIAKEVERILTEWKKEIIFTKVDSLLLKLFPNSTMVKQMVEVGTDYEDSDYLNNISIHSLVSEQQIAEYLLQKGLFKKFS
jgi:hypothetical protein